MNQQQIRALYAKIIAYDNRKPSEANITAWAEQAEVGRWTLQEALDAVTEHHRRSREFLMPAHIHELIREVRRQPAAFVQIEGPPPADEQTVSRIMSIVRGRFSLPSTIRGRKPQPRSAEHQARIDRARAELDELRSRSDP